MAVNYAEKYSTNVDERFSQGARTGAAVNADYDWDGTSAIKVYSIDTIIRPQAPTDTAHPMSSATTHRRCFFRRTRHSHSLSTESLTTIRR